MFSRFSRPIIHVALTLYAQSTLKHFLTQGDSLFLSLFTPLATQGVYALASNYGSLLARLLFQPIEETSRGAFGRLLTPTSSSGPSPAAVRSAHQSLTILIHFYALLSLFIGALAPTFAPLLLRFIAGPAWSKTSAGNVLAWYCYYIPLLAGNGILEAFVASVATPRELQEQSVWMVAFSAGFVAAAFILLKVLDAGAYGLVLANGINMVLRILWSENFVSKYFRRHGQTLTILEVMPRWESLGLGFAASSLLGYMGQSSHDSVWDVAQVVSVGGVFGIIV